MELLHAAHPAALVVGCGISITFLLTALPFEEQLRADDGAQLGASTSLVLVPLVLTSAFGTSDFPRKARLCFFFPLLHSGWGAVPNRIKIK